VNPWEKGIWYVTTALTAAVLVKLWSSGLIRVYKLFFSYLTADFLSSVAGVWIPYGTTASAYYYFSTQTLEIAIAACVIVEIYSLALENTPALAEFGRNTAGYILGAAAIIPAIALLVESSSSGKAYPYLRLYFLFEQTVNATIAAFLVLISLFVAWFPVRLRRNVIVYIGGFIVWTLSRSLGAHLVNQFPKNLVAIRVISSIHMCIDVGCLLFWLFGLERKGEARTAVVGHLWNRAEAERLTGQLDAINDSLARIRHKVKQD
jgi:hypothetical protein